MHRPTLLVICLLSLLCAPGFVCATRVERLEGEVDALRLQFEEIQQRVNDDQTQVSEMLLRADGKLSELEELQRQASQLVKSSSVDFVIQVDGLKTDLAELRGNVDLEGRRLGKLEAEVQAIVGALGSAGGGKAVVLPEGADALMKFSDDALGAGRFDEAIAGYSEFVLRHAADPRIDSALYHLADAYHRGGQHAQAIGTVRSLLSQHKKSAHVNDAIWLMGEAADAMGDCDTAKVAFETLAAVSAVSQKAKARLKTIKSKCP